VTESGVQADPGHDQLRAPQGGGDISQQSLKTQTDDADNMPNVLGAIHIM